MLLLINTRAKWITPNIWRHSLRLAKVGAGPSITYHRVLLTRRLPPSFFMSPLDPRPSSRPDHPSVMTVGGPMLLEINPLALLVCSARRLVFVLTSVDMNIGI